VLILSLLFVYAGLDSAILKWSYMSMGLRGAAIFFGLGCAVVLKVKNELQYVRDSGFSKVPLSLSSCPNAFISHPAKIRDSRSTALRD